jgi:hypothetical protein
MYMFALLPNVLEGVRHASFGSEDNRRPVRLIRLGLFGLVHAKEVSRSRALSASELTQAVVVKCRARSG